MNGTSPQFLSITECLDAACRKRWDQEFFCDPMERLTGQEVNKEVLRVAKELWSSGYKKGDVIAFLCTSSVRHAITFFACQKIGLIPCTLHTNDTQDRLSRLMTFIGAKGLVTDSASNDRAQTIWPYGPKLNLDKIRADSLTAESAYEGDSLPVIDNHPNDTALLLMSSGTTGAPKCVIHTMSSLAAMTSLAPELYRCKSSNDSVLISMAPAFAAWIITSLPMLGLGARFYFDSLFTPERFLKTLQDERISLAPLVPTLWRLILEAGPEQYDLSSTKSVFYSGEPGSADLVDALKNRISPAVCTAFLASEGCAASAIAAGPDILLKNRLLASAAGRPVTPASVRIVDPDGEIYEEVPNGEIGEIVLQSPSIASGYLHNPEQTRKTFIDGWWRSGDLGLRDKNGIIFFKGRTDNQINSGGIKVRAEEIEEVLLKIPEIAQAAVVGEPDDTWGQRIEAHVVSFTPDLTGPAILKHLADNNYLPRMMIPKLVHFHEQLPTGVTGKLYRRALLKTHL